MNNAITSSSASHSWQFRHVILSFLALSAAVSIDLLEEKNEQGRHRFVRGRHKYYGIGSLVVFFALFSGYGMGHMLASMSTISAVGATIAGIVWAAFQWCLERQMLISIRADAAWWKKLVGLTWRTLLALLSASTMVYPFFVESNRAEIDVKVGEMSRQRLVDNLHSAQLAVGLPALRSEASEVTNSIKQVDALLAGEPPDLALFRQKAKQCWTRFNDKETNINRQKRTLQLLQNSVENNPDIEAKIDTIKQKLQSEKMACQAADNIVLGKLLIWKQQKNAEKNLFLKEQREIQTNINLAKQKETALSEDQAIKIKVAARSGFSADFTAVADLVRNDANRRFQLIWWLVWFLAIEMVAVLVKFTSNTDIDLRLNSDETWVNEQTLHQLNLQQRQLATTRLQAAMEHKGEQAARLADDGKHAQDRLVLQQNIETRIHQQVNRLNGELRLSAETLKISLAQMEMIEKLTQQSNLAKHDPRLEKIFQQAKETVLESFARVNVSI
jgi:hypothetical protein